jgi:hypothetical protein
MSFNEHVAATCRAAQNDVDAMNAEIVTTVFGRPVTRGELLAAFNRVADRTNWKNSINAVITISTLDEKNLIREAVIFFTGSVPAFIPVRVKLLEGEREGLPLYRVQAVGYYAAIGA